VDNSASWAPRLALVVLGWVGVGLALAGAIGYQDQRGKLLFGIAALALALLAAHGTIVRPRLVAGRDGLRIRRLGREIRLDWSQARTRLRSTRRLGRDTATLEIEAGEQLFVFGWLELGTDPREVLDVLSTLRS
jgi:PH (Pleckstrin Homology) domain-containing protein